AKLYTGEALHDEERGLSLSLGYIEKISDCHQFVSMIYVCAQTWSVC
ncbi:MAG: hypothetical protein ACI9SB_002525, partial [Candidatus Azotimanducaceae bacterium]